VSDGAARILEALRRAGPRASSGESLSESLGVSRAQVWKYVEALRAKGYQIEGEPGGGYRLTGIPDRLFPEEIHACLATRWLARKIRHLDSTDSTNRVALEWARDGAPHGTTVIAEGQTAGRGRLGRSFFSPPYLNLYSSSVLRPSLALAEAPTLILAAAVAVAQVVAESAGTDHDVEIKWPNDVLIDGLKTSGILMELAAEASRVAFLVLGIGVNLNIDRQSFPDDFRATATSLRSATGRPVDRISFARRLYYELEPALDAFEKGGFQALRPRFEERFRMPGRAVRVLEIGSRGGTPVETAGVCRGIDANGALLVEQRDGEIARVLAGDVTVIR
jgi:BirA family transcriptional regulator, biotin operon repressor / biotin---[acetyl-CoA-carboxylase] ligase